MFDIVQIAQTNAKLSIDSRTICKGDIFIALRGIRFDGHDFVDDALQKGAIAAVVDERWLDNRCPKKNDRLVPVSDTLCALQDISRIRRRNAKYKCIAVTGSNGKTTTKEMLFSVLSEKFRVGKSAGNFNNHIGLPLSIANMHGDLDYAIVEIGGNHPGEIGALAEICMPDIGVITNIGSDHLGLYGTIEKTADATFQMVAWIVPEGTIVYNADDPLSQKRVENILLKKIGIATQRIDASYYAERIEFDVLGCPTFKVNGIEYHIPVAGLHNVYNALAAIAIGLESGMHGWEIARGLSKFQTIEGRWSAVTIGDVTIINDAYNANPDSVSAALTAFRALTGFSRKIVVLGDMHELGEHTGNMHEYIGQCASAIDVDLVIFKGANFGHFLEGFRKGRASRTKITFAANETSLIELLLNETSPNTAILFKASHSTGLFELAARFKTILDCNRSHDSGDSQNGTKPQKYSELEKSKETNDRQLFDSDA